MTHASLLSDLIDLNTALKTDNSLPLERRKRRDRRIGQTLQAQRRQPVRQLHGWLQRVEISGWQRQGQAGVQLYHLLCVMLSVLGLLTGWGVARAVMYYTGDAPINVFNAVGLLVIPQILLLLLWSLTTLPWHLPLFSSLQSALRLLHPGRLARLVAAWFPQRNRHALDVVWDSDNAIVMAPAARWLLSFWSQLFAVWFNLGLLAAVFYLISFSDLAFAWSTTLTLDAATFHRLLSWLSWPWHSLFPQAVPERELVELSRYYRLEAGSLAGGSGRDPTLAAQLGGWWPFLVAALVCYGLLPRLATLLLSWWRFRHHLARALPRLPGSPELLARMNSPLVTTMATTPQPELPADPPGTAQAWQPAGRPVTACAVVVWSDLSDSRQELITGLRKLGIEPTDWFSAGGTRSLQQDRDTVAAVCRSGGAGVAVVARSWEPPLLEFLDFIQSLRAQCQRQQPLLVLLRGDGNGVAAGELDAWRQTLGRLKDPDLHIEALVTTP